MPLKDLNKRREYRREYYKQNKAIMDIRSGQQTVKARERNTKYIKEYLNTHPCVDCGMKDLRTLDFDHVKGQKYKNISLMRIKGASLNRLIAEINKCEVRCANCHRIITYERRIAE